MYFNLLQELKIFFDLLNCEKYEIHLIPFGINNHKTGENDLVFNKHLHMMCKFTHNHIIKQDKEIYVKNIYYLVNEMDIMITGRFHSHIFSAVLNKPFVSLTNSRKSVELMKEFQLEENLYQFQVNDILLPINFDGKKFFDWFTHKVNNLDEIQKKVNIINQKYILLSENILTEWKELIDSYIY